MLLLNQVTDDLIIKIWNWFPLEIREKKGRKDLFLAIFKIFEARLPFH